MIPVIHGRTFVTTVLLAVALSSCKSAAPPAPPVPPAPPPSGASVKVIFEDDFSSYNAQWRQIRGHWAVEKGNMMQLRDDAREANALTYVDNVTISDAEIRTLVTTGAALPQYTTNTPEDVDLARTKRFISGAGLIFRFQDDRNYYMFRLAGEEGAVFGKMKDGQWEDLENPRAADFAGVRLREGTQYELRVRVQGNRVQAWVNDRAVVNRVDTDFATGKIGLVAFRAQAAFAAIRVVEVN